jgi:peptidoglycan/LPS O-acetylase OafA/YrhL
MTVSFFNTDWDLGKFLDFGWLGVLLFFVLSGYLLAAQLLNRNLSLKTVSRFWLRRGLRIYPAFWLQFFVLLALARLFSFMPQLTEGGDIFRHVLLWINMPPWMTVPMNSVWWTLPVELGFYLVLPFLVLLSNRLGWLKVFAGAVLVTFIWRYGVMWFFKGESYSTHQVVLDSIPGALSTFCAGVALAYFIAARGVPNPFQRYFLLAISLFLFVLMAVWLYANLDTYWTGHWMLGVWNPIMGLLIAALMLALILPLKGFGWLASRPMVWLGKISFGIYLWHYPLLMLLQRTILNDWQSPLLSVLALFVTLVATLVLASLSYYLVEKPVMQKRF